MAKFYLDPFDRDREFACQRDFLCHGINYKKGQPFPKETCATRVLRLLYDSRAIGYAEDQPAVAEPAREPTPPPVQPEPTPAPARDPLDHDGDGHRGGVANPTPLTDEEKADLAAQDEEEEQEAEAAREAPAAEEKPAPVPSMTKDERKHLMDHNTRPALVKMVEEHGVTVDPKWTKADLVDEIARARDGAAHG